MFGPRLSRVFASRNNALWWSAMVLVTAYCVAKEPPAATVEESTVQIKEQDRAEKADPWAEMKAVGRQRDALLP